MFTSIAGRAVVVTGGTRGIGKGIASVFARNGARVLITGRDSDVARAAAEELDALAERPGEVSFVQADVSSREDCRRMAAMSQERLGGIDVLCANAGVFPPSRLADMTEEVLDQVLGTNLKGTVFSVPACLSPCMGPDQCSIVAVRWAGAALLGWGGGWCCACGGLGVSGRLGVGGLRSRE